MSRNRSAGVHLLVHALLGACQAQKAELPLGSDTQSCAGCHPSQAAAFALSAHRNSETSPAFEFLANDAERHWGTFARTQCDNCHTPMHDPSGIDGSVTCLSCHAAVGNHRIADGALVVRPEVPLSGVHADTLATSAHQIRVSPFLRAPELCGTCHEVTGPNLLREPTYSEFQSSRANDVRTCIDCHMPEEQGLVSVQSRTQRVLRSHRFLGLTPAWLGDENERSIAREQAENLLRQALRLTVAIHGQSVLIQLIHGDALHNVPTGASMFRDIWVDVVFRSEDGQSIRVPRVLELGDRPVTQDGSDLVTRATEVVANALHPGETRGVTVPVPDTAERVEVELSARAYRRAILDHLSASAAQRVPVLQIARVTQTIP